MRAEEFLGEREELNTKGLPYMVLDVLPTG
jgi:hypothetical protein